MNLTLKNVKYAAFASEETDCFQATVYINGVPSISANNDGRGGCTHLHDIVKGSVEKLDAYAKTLPEEVYGDLSYKLSADGVVDNLFTKWLTLRDLNKALKKTCFQEKGKIYTIKNVFTPVVSKYLKTKYPTCIILNELPEEKALEIWMKR